MLFQGALLGLSLSFMVGPLLFAIVQASLERGFRAGFSLAAGIWTSDALYITMVYYGVDALAALTALPHFRLWAGLAGGLVLVIFGLTALLRRNVPLTDDHHTPADRVLDVLDGPEKPGVEHNWMRWGYAGYWLRGFLLNTINPFTVFFWLGIASAVVVPNQWAPRETLAFFSGMLGALILTDTLKAYAAKRVRHFLTPAHTRWVQKGIGLTLLVFGVVLVIRVLV
ncbi:MAG: LysE family translocator [Saprospirales bacterium]|jgi:threonine/homoserine/homoserine lactone efflux protein|nr:LysE family translocator [Saprospirales bacterium]MBK8923632.1 LysE family translocator [Saprospirales bacterium]